MSNSQMPGRAAANLVQRLRECGDANERRQLEVQLAGVLARLSRTQEARALIVELRHANQAYEPRLSSWIMFTEGLVAHFESLDLLRARDWFKRSYAIAVAIGDQQLRTISAAWLADSELRSANLDSALTYLKIAFRDTDRTSHETRGRACLVFADMMSWVGMPDESRIWYRKARDHAVAIGEIGMQSAILFNSASFRVAELVTQDCFGHVSGPVAKLLQLEVTSVSNLDQGLGIKNLTSLVPVLSAELQTVLGDWESAVSTFDRFLGQLGIDGQERLAAKFIAHRAWCKVNLGLEREAVSDVDTALKRLEKCAELDDLAIVHARIQGVYERTGDVALACNHREMAERCLTAHLDAQVSRRAAVQAALIEVTEKENPA